MPGFLGIWEISIYHVGAIARLHRASPFVSNGTKYGRSRKGVCFSPTNKNGVTVNPMSLSPVGMTDGIEVSSHFYKGQRV